MVRLVLCAAFLTSIGCRPDAAGGDTAALTDAETPADLARQVATMLPRLERLSGLDRRDVLRVRRQTRAQARAYVLARLDQELPPVAREAVRRTYVALGLVPDTLDLDALLLDLYTEQILGYYDPGTKAVYVVASEDLDMLRPMLAHELVHALQDQHVDLDSLISTARGNDRRTAAHAAMEGHAMIVMFALLAELSSRRTIDPATLPDPAHELGPALEQQNTQFPVFRRAPLVIREGVMFPYLAGSSFVHELWRSLHPRARYPAPIDTLLPQSTEQVMRPAARFIGERDEPSLVVIEELPRGWQAVREDDLGQLETAIFLHQHLGSDARAAADGWDGDRYILLRDDAGREVLHWFSAWDTRAAADAFAAAAARAAVNIPQRSAAVTRIPDRARELVYIVIAPPGAAAAALPAPRIRIEAR